MLSISMGLLLTAAQASPSQADLRCIVEAMSPADRAAMAESARREEPSLGPAGERLTAAAVACGQRLGWDARTAGEMTGLSVSLILRDEAGRRIGEAGIPPARIERWFENQSLAVRTAADISEETSQRLVEALHAGGLPLPRIEAQGQLIGVYLGARVMIERFERGLPIGD